MATSYGMLTHAVDALDERDLRVLQHHMAEHLIEDREPALPGPYELLIQAVEPIIEAMRAVRPEPVSWRLITKRLNAIGTRLPPDSSGKAKEIAESSLMQAWYRLHPDQVPGRRRRRRRARSPAP